MPEFIGSINRDVVHKIPPAKNHIELIDNWLARNRGERTSEVGYQFTFTIGDGQTAVNMVRDVICVSGVRPVRD